MKVSEADDPIRSTVCRTVGYGLSLITGDPNHFGFGRELQKVIKEELGDESRIRGNGQSRSWTLCQEFGGEGADIEEV